MVLIFQLKKDYYKIVLKSKIEVYTFHKKKINKNSWEKNSGVKLLILRKHILVSGKVYIKMMTINGIQMVFS